MPCLFVRIFHDKRSFTITPEVTPGCEWVFAGEGVATIKWDGTACMVRDGILYKHYDAKRDRKTGEFRMPPPGAIACDEPDHETGHWPHWVAVDPTKPEDKHHVAAWEALDVPRDLFPNGTYELCGPGVQGNPHKLERLELIRHGSGGKVWTFRNFETIRELCRGLEQEGIVFHHPDGRMCKIRRADFGFQWPMAVAS
jgi:hypothetical protein